MKHTLVIISLLLGMSLTLQAQSKFQVQGKFSDTAVNGARVTLSYFNGEKKVYSSAIIKDESFILEGMVKEVSKASINISSPKKVQEMDAMKAVEAFLPLKQLDFFIEGGLVTIAGNSLRDAAVKAPGKTQKEYLVLEAGLKPYVDKERSSYMDMLKSVIAKDKQAEGRYKAVNEQAKLQIDSAKLAFMKANPKSYVSLTILEGLVYAKSLAEEKEKLSAWYQALASPLKASIVGKKLGNQIAMAFKLGPGNTAENFVLNDTLGNPVPLYSLRGKYVLLDFWASWCMPCRAENPVVRKAYEKFKDKNFTVLSVSLEKPGDRKAWVDAINKDKLTWTQVAALTEEEGKMMRALYSIQSIPMNFLIDPQGKIVATYLRGDALLKKLEEVL